MKTLTFKPAKRKALTFWSDKLSRINVETTNRYTRVLDNIKYDIVQWAYINNLGKSRVYTSISIPVDQDVPFSRKLISTRYGYVCPACRSNEHVKSRINLQPMSIKEANYYNAEEYGYYCEQHGLIS